MISGPSPRRIGRLHWVGHRHWGSVWCIIKDRATGKDKKSVLLVFGLCSLAVSYIGICTQSLTNESIPLLATTYQT